MLGCRTVSWRDLRHIRAECVAVHLATRGLRIYAFSIVLYGINNSFVNYIQGMRRSALSTTYSFLQNFLFVVVPALALSGIIGTDAVWVAFPIGEALTLVAIVALAAVRKGGAPFGFKDFLFLKEPFGAPEDEVLDITISKPEEVIPASTLTDEFCTSKNADASTRLRLSLFVEELGNNVAEYGFVEGERNILEIRVVHLDEGWILRLRDNCKAFDPVKWVQLNQSDDPAANIGIKMVCRMAKQVTYVSTLDLNVLTLRI